MIKRIDYEKCSRCGRCVEVCPMDVFRHLGHIVYIAHRQDCMTCFFCEDVCLSNAIYVAPDRGHTVVFPF